MKKSIISLLSILVLLTPTYVLAEEDEGGSTPTETSAPVATATPEPTPEPTPTAEEKEEKPVATPTPTPTPEVKKEYKYTIDSIKITGGELVSPSSFKSDVYKYTIKVTDKDKFKIEAKTTDEDGIARCNIDWDSANYDIIKTNGVRIWSLIDGKYDTDKVYIFELEKDKLSSKLSKLELEGGNFPFNEKFDKDTKNYTVTIPNEVDTITINAVAEEEDAKITISPEKTTDLKVGTNTFKITVKNGNNSTTYTLRVTRSEEEEVEEKATSIISVTSEDLNKSTTTTGDFEEPDNPDSTFNLIIVTLGSLLLFAIGVLGIYFYIKTSPRRMKKEILKERNNKGKQEPKEESPIIEVTQSNVEKNESNDKGPNVLDNADNIIENLEDTKEFK